MDKTKADNPEKPKLKNRVGKKTTAVEELTTEEREAVTVVFHQFETGLREGTIFTKVSISFNKHLVEQSGARTPMCVEIHFEKLNS